jgi:beta-carotene 15,15'-dioxygenase
MMARPTPNCERSRARANLSTRRSAVGCVACAVLIIACGAQQFGHSVDVLKWPGTTASTILLFGMPHGALDIELLKFRSDRAAPFSLFRSLLGYVAVALAALSVWWLLPSLALVLFLLLSSYHFGGDWVGFVGFRRFVIGAAVLSAPAMLHMDAVGAIFSWLVPEFAAHTIANVMHWLSFLLTTSASMLVITAGPERRAESEEITIVVLSAIVLLPITFFVIYFCALHSMRHLLDARHELAAEKTTSLVVFGAPYGLVAVACCCAGILAFPHLTLGTALLSATFVGLAALTAPHMLLRQLP